MVKIQFIEPENRKPNFKKTSNNCHFDKLADNTGILSEWVVFKY